MCKNYKGGTCLKCEDFYYLDNNSNACKPCEKGCKSCTNSQSCDACIENYLLVDKTCIFACPDFCSLCENLKCITCNECYFLSQKICAPCSSNCKSCIDLRGCMECYDGYLLTHDSQCALCDNATIISSLFSFDFASITVIFSSNITILCVLQKVIK